MKIYRNDGFRVTFAVLMGAFLATWAGSPTAIADPPPFGGAGATSPSNEVTNFNGKLIGMRRGVVIVEKDDGTQAMVMPPDSVSSFQFVAKATPAFLRRGMLVRFTGDFNAGGIPIAPISKVTLFQPVDVRSLHGRAKEQFTPGVYAQKKSDAQNRQAGGKATVVGSLIGVMPNGVMAVQAGKVPVRVPVNQETQLEVRYNSLALAQEGDKVSVAGFYQPSNENQVKADRITITTDRVYGEYKPEPEKKSRRPDSKKEDGDEAGDDDAADKDGAGDKPDDDADGDKNEGDKEDS